MDEMDKLLQFELLLFKRVELNEKPNSQQQFGKAHPYLSNSYNLFADVFDCSYSSGRNGKAPLDMEHLIEHANFQDVLQAVSILDKQKSMIRFLKSYPLIRERIEEIQDFDVAKVKECLDRAKKMLQKIKEIFLFQDYEADP